MTRPSQRWTVLRKMLLVQLYHLRCAGAILQSPNVYSHHGRIHWLELGGPKWQNSLFEQGFGTWRVEYSIFSFHAYADMISLFPMSSMVFFALHAFCINSPSLFLSSIQSCELAPQSPVDTLMEGVLQDNAIPAVLLGAVQDNAGTVPDSVAQDVAVAAVQPEVCWCSCAMWPRPNVCLP